MSFSILEFWTYVLVSLSLPNFAVSNCGNNRIGDSVCVRVTDYYASQWATCLTSAYIEQVSSNAHTCTDSASYCFYQCMLEEYGKESGFVQGACRCSPGDTAPLPDPSAPVLPDECYSPDGTDCSWYQDCLHATYPCTDEQTGNTIAYAEDFCALYNDSVGVLSSAVRSWINSARKCLQISLVHFMRTYNYRTTCSDIKTVAVASHPACYLDSSNEQEQDICDLTCLDWLTLFWKMVDSFNTATSSEGLNRLLTTALGCPSLSGCASSMPGVENAFITRRLVIRAARELYVLESIADQDVFASLIADEIVGDIGATLNAGGIGWFGHVPAGVSIGSVYDIVVDVYVVNLGILGLGETSGIDMMDVSREFLDLIQQGLQFTYTDGAGNVYTGATDELLECHDFGCSSSTQVVCTANCLNRDETLLSSCEISNGTKYRAGDSICVGLTDYYTPQWATCLSRAYIEQQVSSNTHTCTDSVSYCWYQCMLEEYDTESGFVQGACRCAAGDTTPLPDPVLPDECYSPNGTDCSWYQDCLETTYPCTELETGSTIKYAIDFCEMYKNIDGVLSSQAQTWINHARKCLQFNLVHFLRRYADTTCSGIKETALSSHANCYLDSPDNAQTICNLPCLDWLTIFYTMVDKSNSQLLSESLPGLLEAAQGCPPSSNLGSSKCATSDVGIPEDSFMTRRLVVQVPSDLYYSMSSTVDQDAFASSVANQIAEQLGWNSDEIGWFGHVPDSVSIGSSYDIVVDILVADLGKLGLKNSSSIELLNTSDSLVNLLQDGVEFSYTTDGGERYTGVGHELLECNDFVCSNSSQVVCVGDCVERNRERTENASTQLQPMNVSRIIAFVLCVTAFYF